MHRIRIFTRCEAINPFVYFERIVIEFRMRIVDRQRMLFQDEPFFVVKWWYFSQNQLFLTHFEELLLLICWKRRNNIFLLRTFLFNSQNIDCYHWRTHRSSANDLMMYFSVSFYIWSFHSMFQRTYSISTYFASKTWLFSYLFRHLHKIISISCFWCLNWNLSR